MPRSKNPNPSHISSPEHKNVAVTSSIEQSTSPTPSMTSPSPPLTMTSSGSTSPSLSIDEPEQNGCPTINGVSDTLQHAPDGPASNGVLRDGADHLADGAFRPADGDVSEPPRQPESFQDLLLKFQTKNYAEGKKGKRRSLDVISARLIPWLNKRFSLKAGSKTSASQVIELYKNDFQDSNSVPLHNYQVGQLVRRLFPQISRCKITLNGKRVWVYKDLNILDELEGNDLTSDGLGSSLRTSIEDNLSPNPQKHSGILYNLLYPQKTMDDVTTVAKRDGAGGDIIQWLRDNYEYCEGSYVRSLEILRRHNRDQEGWMKYLSQVGRAIKQVFPKARHIRRSLHGGKREWIYHNLRSKIPYNDVSGESSVTSYDRSRPTMVTLYRGWNRPEVTTGITAEPKERTETNGTDEIPIDYSVAPSNGDGNLRIVEIKSENVSDDACDAKRDGVTRDDVTLNLTNRKRSHDDVRDHVHAENAAKMCKSERPPVSDVTVPKVTSSLQQRFSFLTERLLSDNRIKSGVCSTNHSPPARSADQSEASKEASPRSNGCHGNEKTAGSHVMKWEELPMCATFNYGWALAPVNKGCDFFEWFLFDGQNLCSGQRVFKELKIFADWSVHIHVMGRRVFPDELGGITDLQKTRKSVDKVFLTLAESTICRGFPALCLSDLKVHEVVVAKTEIWSSRDSEEEELRHRAINCQVLFREKGDCCQKCARVIKAHSGSKQKF